MSRKLQNHQFIHKVNMIIAVVKDDTPEIVESTKKSKKKKEE